MLTRADSDRFLVTLLEAITDYHKDETTVDVANKHVITSKERIRLRTSTQGWKLKALLSDRAESWTPLKDLKESNLIDVAKFVKGRNLESDPACYYSACAEGKGYNDI